MQMYPIALLRFCFTLIISISRLFELKRQLGYKCNCNFNELVISATPIQSIELYRPREVGLKLDRFGCGWTVGLLFRKYFEHHFLYFRFYRNQQYYTGPVAVMIFLNLIPSVQARKSLSFTNHKGLSSIFPINVQMNFSLHKHNKYPNRRQ